MNDAAVSEVLIALFVGLVAFAIMRRGTSTAIELVLWIGLIWVCMLGVASTHDKQTRELTSAAVWGVTQTVGTVGGLMGQTFLSWLSENRIAVATWVVLAFGVDLLAIVLLHTHRQAIGWQPRVRLRDWMEMPRPGKPMPAPVPVVSGVDELNERFDRWAPLASASVLTQLTMFLIWSLDVLVPAAARRLRNAAFAANDARRRVADGAKVVQIETFTARVASVRGWAGGALNQVASVPVGMEDDEAQEPDRRDRLAS
jgi:preprotein translocase subunit YajC